MHQDIEGSLAASSISHAGGPQSPARSAENLLNGHRPKGLMELRREESVPDTAAAPMVLVGSAFPFSSSAPHTHLFNRLSLGGLFCWLKLLGRVGVRGRQGSRSVHLGCSQAEKLPLQVRRVLGFPPPASDGGS